MPPRHGRRTAFRAKIAWLVGLIAISASPASAAEAAPVDNIRQLFAALNACFKPPRGSGGSELTLRFSITNRGELRGKPVIAYSKLVGDIDLQRRFVGSALSALARCTPLSVTERFGPVASQKMIRWRLIVLKGTPA